MTIEIHQPEVEALIGRLMESGQFHNVEEALLHALRAAPLPVAYEESNFTRTGGEAARPKRRLKLDPPLIPPAGRRIRIADEEIYDLIEFP